MCKILDEFCRGFLDGRAEKVEDMLELHFKSRMPAPRSIEDRLSLAHLVTELGDPITSSI